MKKPRTIAKNGDVFLNQTQAQKPPWASGNFSPACTQKRQTWDIVYEINRCNRCLNSFDAKITNVSKWKLKVRELTRVRYNCQTVKNKTQLRYFGAHVFMLTTFPVTATSNLALLHTNEFNVIFLLYSEWIVSLPLLYHYYHHCYYHYYYYCYHNYHFHKWWLSLGLLDLLPSIPSLL